MCPPIPDENLKSTLKTITEDFMTRMKDIISTHIQSKYRDTTDQLDTFTADTIREARKVAADRIKNHFGHKITPRECSDSLKEASELAEQGRNRRTTREEDGNIQTREEMETNEIPNHELNVDNVEVQRTERDRTPNRPIEIINNIPENRDSNLRDNEQRVTEQDGTPPRLIEVINTTQLENLDTNLRDSEQSRTTKPKPIEGQ